MENVVKAIINKFWPELANDYHLAHEGIVKAIPSPPATGDSAEKQNPRYAVNVQLLDEHGNATGPIYENVRISTQAAGRQRGFFAFPSVGTKIIVQFAYGRSDKIYISDILIDDLALPGVGTQEIVIAKNANSHWRFSDDESQHLTAANKTTIGNGDIDIVAELHRLSSILEGHTHPDVAKGNATSGPPVQAGAIAAVTGNVGIVKK